MKDFDGQAFMFTSTVVCIPGRPTAHVTVMGPFQIRLDEQVDLTGVFGEDQFALVGTTITKLIWAALAQMSKTEPTV